MALLVSMQVIAEPTLTELDKPRVIVTTDGEADDRCSMIRFLLSANEFEVEGIINSSSEFHWVGGQGWHEFHPVNWVAEQIDLYAEVYPNLRLHSSDYPTPEYLRSIWKIGNINGIGESDEMTEGALLIVDVLLDDSDPRPVWIQAWGGTGTLAKALKIIQQNHPEQMQAVADKMRLFLIWEQDNTYQDYIRPHWEHLNVQTIIADQFDAMAYIWRKVLPDSVKPYFEADWMQQHILTNHGELAAAYEALDGAFHAEGDTPAFLHSIPNGLRSIENPSWGGWGGRYVNVRHNVWMDPAPQGQQHTTGRWFINNSWSKQFEDVSEPALINQRTLYFKPIWRWLDAVQNDFAARADWSVKSYQQANHHPKITLTDTAPVIRAKAGATVHLDASASVDPDGDSLSYLWWHYYEVSGLTQPYWKSVAEAKASFVLPTSLRSGDEIHFIAEVTDDGTPTLTRYQRVIVRID